MSETPANNAASTGAPRRGARWLLLGSLALNLFFIGIAVAMLVRGPPPPRHWDRDVFVRMNRLADRLPPADGQILRTGIEAHHDAIANAQAAYHSARDSIRATLRQEPFKEDAMLAAMAKTRTTRQSYYELLGGVFANAAAKMSPAGRQALANWPHRRKPRNNPR